MDEDVTDGDAQDFPGAADDTKSDVAGPGTDLAMLAAELTSPVEADVDSYTDVETPEPVERHHKALANPYVPMAHTTRVLGSFNGLDAIVRPRFADGVLPGNKVLRDLMVPPALRSNAWRDVLLGQVRLTPPVPLAPLTMPSLGLKTSVSMTKALRISTKISGLSDQLGSIGRLDDRLGLTFGSRLQANEKLLMSLTSASADATVLSRRPLVNFEQLLRTVDAGAGDALLDQVRTHSFGVSALVGQDVLLAPRRAEYRDDFEDIDVEGTSEVVEAQIIEPWQAARAETYVSLYTRLCDLDPKLGELLAGGWDNVARQGPAFAESASNATLEVLDRTLRYLAPEDAVRSDAKDRGLNPSTLESSQGRLTRTARVRYVMRDRKSERKLLSSEVDALCAAVNELVGCLNAGKHASRADSTLVRVNLVAVEAVLQRLLP